MHGHLCVLVFFSLSYALASFIATLCANNRFAFSFLNPFVSRWAVITKFKHGSIFVIGNPSKLIWLVLSNFRSRRVNLLISRNWYLVHTLASSIYETLIYTLRYVVKITSLFHFSPVDDLSHFLRSLNRSTFWKFQQFNFFLFWLQ